MKSRFTEEELRFWKEVYLFSIKSGSSSSMALFKANTAVVDLRTNVLDNPDISEEELKEMKKRASGGVVKMTDLDHIKVNE